MSVNSRFAIDQNKTKYFGSIFHTIDFEVSRSITKDHYLYSGGKTKNRNVGVLFIDNDEHKMSINDLKTIKNEYGCLESTIWRQRPKNVDIRIKSKDYTVSRHEFFRIIETVDAAIENISKSYQMGTLY